MVTRHLGLPQNATSNKYLPSFLDLSVIFTHTLTPLSFKPLDGQVSS
jgi:hypothetical protein